MKFKRFLSFIYFQIFIYLNVSIQYAMKPKFTLKGLLNKFEISCF